MVAFTSAKRHAYITDIYLLLSSVESAVLNDVRHCAAPWNRDASVYALSGNDDDESDDSDDGAISAAPQVAIVVVGSCQDIR